MTDARQIRNQKITHGLAWIAAFGMFLLIAVGAVVTTTRAGDTEPGWSWRFWEWFVTWMSAEGGLAWELGHRMIATIVGMVVIPMAWFHWRGMSGRVRWLGLTVLVLVVVQGILGGVRVLVVSDVEVQQAVVHATGGGDALEARRAAFAMAHGITAQVTFALLCCILLLTSSSWQQPTESKTHPRALGTRHLAVVAWIAVVGQLALGTLVRQTGHHVMWHVAGAFTVTSLLVTLCFRAFLYHRDSEPVRRVATWIIGLLVVQVFLGITPWMLSKGNLDAHAPDSVVAILRSAHVVTGASILVALSFLTLWIHRTLAPGVIERLRRDHAQIAPRVSLWADLAQLTKFRLSGLVMVTVAAGYFLAAKSDIDWVLLVFTMVGVSLTAAGTSALNQYIERDRDALMERTRDRPLPSGRMKPANALVFGLFTLFAGVVLLVAFVNHLAAGLTLATSVVYLLIYTPMKTRTTLNTLVGAISGAIPPVIGWAAVTGQVDTPAWALFAILFVWQLPHFWAIAWLYRGDYSRAGMKMLTVVHDDPGFLVRQILLWCMALLLTSLMPVAIGMAGVGYAVAALVLGFGFLGVGLWRSQVHDQIWARRVFFASLAYLPILLGSLLIDVW